MASVTSLDKDLRNLRMDKYTPQRAKETLQWIEGILGERLGSADLLEALKDGTVLCRLANMALGENGVRFKQSAMPFVQMENISHFLRACQNPPFSLPPHDVFLTVDLYEQKDPAQVLQCIGAFSRKASALQPSKFPTSIGGKRGTALSPQTSGLGTGAGHSRGISNSSADKGSGYGSGSPLGRSSPSKGFTTSPPGASTWSKKKDIGNEAPAWNIAQYGWTGGASQGNQGVSFGAPRQLVTEQPRVPSLAEKERRRREKEEEAERQRGLAAEEERRHRAQVEEEERAAQEEEAKRWKEETERQREHERLESEAEKMRWLDEERKWKEEEDQRKREETEAEEKAERERNTRPALHGQYLSQYRSSQSKSPVVGQTPENERIKELERQLEEAREREKRYESERLKLDGQRTGSVQDGPTSKPLEDPTPNESCAPVDDEWANRDAERGFLRQQWKKAQEPLAEPPRPLPVPGAQSTASISTRPLPVPGKLPAPAPGPKPASVESTPEKPTSPRPLPNPSTYVASKPVSSRTDSFLASNPAPTPSKPASFTPPEAAFSSAAEQSGEDSRRQAGQQKTRAGGWASKSLLEREMERERERQREWEEGQKATRAAVERGDVDNDAGVGPGQSWDVNTYGFTGGDNLNKSGSGVFSGRRQIIGGPRPIGGK